MKKRTDAQIEESMKRAKASLEIEGLIVTDEHTALVRKRLKGEITQEEFLRLAKERALKAD